jgi:intracellular multiplication protein IcmE
LIIGVSAVALTAVLFGVTLDGKSKPVVSSDARMQAVNGNPGGLYSDPEQNALALHANDTAANAALAKGTSYTPPLAPSVPIVNETPAPPPSVASSAPLPAQHFAPPAQQTPAPPPPAIQQVDAPVFPPPLPGTAVQQPQGFQTADNGGNQQQTAYSAAINGLLSQWNGRPPLTDVVLPPPAQTNGSPLGQTANSGSAAQGGASPAASAATDPDPAASAQHVMIPAGRGIFAHPILALSSDETSPVV